MRARRISNQLVSSPGLINCNNSFGITIRKLCRYDKGRLVAKVCIKGFYDTVLIHTIVKSNKKSQSICALERNGSK